MNEEKYAVEFWGGDKNGAVRYYKHFSSAKAAATKFVKRCYYNSGLSLGDCYAEIYYIQRLPKFKYILVRTVDRF